jgi:nonribosomal peptide synthetase MxcG
VKQRAYPLTRAARGIWFGQTRSPACRAYWTAEYLELQGELDVQALERAVDHTLREAETLHQRVFREGDELLALIDVPGHIALPQSAMHCTEALSRLDTELPEAPNLGLDDLYAVELIRVSETLHYLQLRVHHLALDGTGYGLLYERLLRCYAQFRLGTTPPFEARSLHGVVAEEEAYRSSVAFELDREHYAQLLQDAAQPTPLAPLRPIGPRPRLGRAHLRHEVVIAGQSELRGLKVEPVALLLAVLGCWLWEHSGQTQHVVGLAVVGRYSALALRTPSMAMNIVPVRIDVEPTTSVAALAHRIQEQLRAGRIRQRYRYEDLRTDCLERGVSRPFGVVLNYMPFAPPPQAEGLRVRRCPLAAGPVEDLTLSLVADAAGWRSDIEAHPDAYDETRMKRLHASWLDRLQTALIAPARTIAELFTSDTPAARLVNTTDVDAIDLLARLQRHARLCGSAPALHGQGEPPLNYAQLLSEVRGLGAALLSKGVGAGDFVAVLLRRSPVAVIAQLATLWAGAAYVPIDPDGPIERIQRVLATTSPKAIVVDSADVARLSLERASCLSPAERGSPIERVRVPDTHPAYAIFTSGSTGTPNGVEISRRALAHFTGAALHRYGICAGDRVLQFSPLQFDASVEEIHLTLAAGATLVLRSDEMLESFGRFVSACDQLGITVLDLPTAYWHELVDAPSALCAVPRLRLWIIGGEAAHPEKVERHFQRFGQGAQLMNTYGPTETTVVCATSTLTPARPSSRVPIGGPLPGVELRVVDAVGRTLRQGQPGQLAVLGPGLASGYLGKPELTATRFVQLPDCAPETRAYLTGDHVQQDEHGELVYLGRLDDELKLSGHRVQPLEVEVALGQIAGVVECAVVVDRAAAPPRLVAYYVTGQPAPAPEALRAALRARVHPAAIPSRMQAVTCLPRDANGKVDRRALRALVPESVEQQAPLAGAQHAVAEAFAAVLGRSVNTAEADFFALGGHSLAALQLAARLTRNLGFEVPLSSVFEHTTVRELAQAITSGPQLTAGSSDPLSPYVVLREGDGPTVFCVHPADGLAYCYWGLGAHWPGVRLIGLQPWALRHPEITGATAAIRRHAELITELAPTGQIHLLGYSSGGGLAFELAALLHAEGRSIGTLALLDSFPSDIWAGTPPPTLHDALVSMLDDLDASARDATGALVSIESLYDRLLAPESTLAVFNRASIALMARVALEGMLAYRTIRHCSWDGDLVYFAADRGPCDRPTWHSWLPYLRRAPQVVSVPTFHLGMTQPQILQRVAETLWPRLQNSARAMAQQPTS